MNVLPTSLVIQMVPFLKHPPVAPLGCLCTGCMIGMTIIIPGYEIDRCTKLS